MNVVRQSVIRRAARTGSVLDGLRAGQPGLLDAVMVRAQCLRLANETDPRGLRIRHARITGQLDLSSVVVPFPLDFEGCSFDEPLMLDGATLQSLGLRNCLLSSLIGNGLQVRRDLDLSGSTVRGSTATTASFSSRAAVWLCEADIGGRLLCLGADIEATDGRAVKADRMRVGGAVRFIEGFRAQGEVRLLGVQVGGSLEFAAATMINPEGSALLLGDATIEGSLFMTDDLRGNPSRFTGWVDLNSAEVGGKAVIRNLTVTPPATTRDDSEPVDPGPMRHALAAPRVTVGATLTIEGTTVLAGGLDLSSAKLGGLVIGGRCRLDHPGSVALTLTNAQIDSDVTLDRGLTIRGRTAMSRAWIRGKLTLRKVTLTDGGVRTLLDAYSARVDGAVDFQDLVADGGRVVLNGATIGSLIASRASITHPSGQTLNLRQTQVDGAVFLTQGFTSTGHVVLDGARIAGHLDLQGGSFVCPLVSPETQDGEAVSAIATTAAGGMYLAWERCEPSIDLTGATTSTLVDDPTRWPARYALTGFTYDRFDGSATIPAEPWDVDVRCRWLDRAVFDTGAYEQAARVFRQHGFGAEAEKILIRQRDASGRELVRRAASLRSRRPARLQARWRSWREWVYGRTVGYGYRPGRVLAAIAVLLALTLGAVQTPQVARTLRSADPSGTVYTVTGRLDPIGSGTRTDRCGNGQVRCFDPVLFAVDTVVPLVNLGQRDAWYPDPHVAWGRATLYLLSAATLLGWLLSTILVLSFARLARAG